MNEEPTPIAGVSRHHALLTRLVTRLLAKEPADRPGSAAAIVRELVEVGPPSPRPQPHRFVRVAGVVALLGLGAWMVWGRHGASDPPCEGLIAVRPFKNLADVEDRKLGPIIGILLASNLAQSGLRVLDDERVLEIFHQLGGGADSRAADQLMRRYDVDCIVSGSIIQTSPALFLVASVSSAASHQVLQPAKFPGHPGLSVQYTVDSLSARLIRSMSASRGIASARSWPAGREVAPGAYRAYVEGLESLVRGDDSRAEESFLASVRQDSGFAPARRQLEHVRWIRASRTARESP